MGTGCNFDRAYAWSSEAGDMYAQVAKLKSSDAAEEDSWGRSAALGDRFGLSVAVAGGTVVVGVPGDDVVKDKNMNVWGGGSVYVFRTTDDGATYGQVAKLTAPDAVWSDGFGDSVAIDGATVVVGSRHDDDNGEDSGSAYVFREEGSGGAAGAATASVGLIVGVVVAAAVAVVLGYLALNRFRSQSRASEQASAADAEDIKLEAAFSDAADEMAAAEPSTGQQAAP